MKYLCGCEDRGLYRSVTTAVGLSFVAKDDQGFEVCPEHGQREYGWRSRLNRELRQTPEAR